MLVYWPRKLAYDHCYLLCTFTDQMKNYYYYYYYYYYRKCHGTWRTPPDNILSGCVKLCLSFMVLLDLFLKFVCCEYWNNCVCTEYFVYLQNPLIMYFFYGACSPIAGCGLLILEVFRDHTRHTTVGRTPLDEWSARRTDLYLTTHNTHNRRTSIIPVGFEPTISAGERPQTYALDRVATGTGPY